MNVSGLNNQKRDLRNALAMAKALDVGIVMPGFFMHYKENRRGNSTQQILPPGQRPCFKDTRGKWRYMNFNQVVDKQPIETWINAASVKELRAAKWDGKLGECYIVGAVGVVVVICSCRCLVSL
jgi:hypothetical protein